MWNLLGMGGCIFTCVITLAVDINECVTGTDSCQQDEICVNTQGSFSCTPPATPSSPSSVSTSPTTTSAPTPSEEPFVFSSHTHTHTHTTMSYESHIIILITRYGSTLYIGIAQGVSHTYFKEGKFQFSLSTSIDIKVKITIQSYPYQNFVCNICESNFHKFFMFFFFFLIRLKK